MNLVVDDGESLGLMIRGGREFSLGIYITGIDAFSVAEQAELKVGIAMIVDWNSTPKPNKVSFFKLKLFIHFGLTHTHRCVLVLYTQYFHEFVKKNRHITLVRFEPRTVSILEQCHTNRPQRLPLAWGSLNPMSNNMFYIYLGQQVGDQILDVNGENFLDINHQEAVNILKSSKLMMMTIKDVGKLPYARTTIDRTQWITGDGVSDLPSQVSRPGSVVNGETVHNGTNGNMVNGDQHNGFPVSLERGEK